MSSNFPKLIQEIKQQKILRLFWSQKSTSLKFTINIYLLCPPQIDSFMTQMECKTPTTVYEVVWGFGIILQSSQRLMASCSVYLLSIFIWTWCSQYSSLRRHCGFDFENCQNQPYELKWLWLTIQVYGAMKILKRNLNEKDRGNTWRLYLVFYWWNKLSILKQYIFITSVPVGQQSVPV